MRKSKGSIVNVASDADLFGDVDSGAVYCASKGGVVNMSRTMALKLAPDVRVNCVCPGYVDTDRTTVATSLSVTSTSGLEFVTHAELTANFIDAHRFTSIGEHRVTRNHKEFGELG